MSPFSAPDHYVSLPLIVLCIPKLSCYSLNLCLMIQSAVVSHPPSSASVSQPTTFAVSLLYFMSLLVYFFIFRVFWFSCIPFNSAVVSFMKSVHHLTTFVLYHLTTPFVPPPPPPPPPPTPTQPTRPPPPVTSIMLQIYQYTFYTVSHGRRNYKDTKP